MMKAAKKSPQVPFIQSLDRGLAILQKVAGSKQPVTLGELAEMLSIDRSSAFRLAHTLRRRGFLSCPPGRKVRVNDVEGVAGFVLPGDHVDVVLTRQRDKESATNDVVIQNAGVLAIDQLADARAEKPSVVKAVTLEVDETDGQKLALASAVGTLSLLLGKAGETTQDSAQQVSLKDLGRAIAPSSDARFITIGVTREFKRQDYTVPVAGGNTRAAALPGKELAQH